MKFLAGMVLYFVAPLVLVLAWGEYAVPTRTMMHPDPWMNIEVWWLRMCGIGSSVYMVALLIDLRWGITQ